jgi:hypothetical protein
MEKNYDFRERLRQVHKKDRKNDAVWQKIAGAAIDDSWQILFPDDAGAVVRNAVRDLQEYFESQVKLLNARMAPYKAVKRVKLRDSEFQKNTSRKITRFNIDKTID